MGIARFVKRTLNSPNRRGGLYSAASYARTYSRTSLTCEASVSVLPVSGHSYSYHSISYSSPVSSSTWLPGSVTRHCPSWELPSSSAARKNRLPTRSRPMASSSSLPSLSESDSPAAAGRALFRRGSRAAGWACRRGRAMLLGGVYKKNRLFPQTKLLGTFYIFKNFIHI